MLTLKTTTISSAWFELLYAIFDRGYKQNIQKGSFENEQYRVQYPGIAIEIEYPWLDMIPVIPCCLNIPAPTTQEYIEDYFVNYLMGSSLAENETYTYGSRINEEVSSSYTQLEMVIDMLKNTPMTNQACIEIAKSEDIAKCIGNDGKLDSPCLRLIDFKVIPKKYHVTDAAGYNYEAVRLNLTMSVYFRSWDLWAGFPTNLGGLELLKQFVAQECNLENGKMYCYSSGLHLYGYQEKIAKIRIARKEN